MKVAIIDYQVSNLYSVKHACDSLGLKSEITSEKDSILNSDVTILPGVGAFSNAMNNLKRLDLIGPIIEFIDSGKPFMGICLGLQLLFSESDEFENCKGLNIIEGSVIRFPNFLSNGQKVHVPHVGWNQIHRAVCHSEPEKSGPLFQHRPGAYMYFVHSYYVVPADTDLVLTVTPYADIEFCSSILTGNIFATQFHPEKSGKAGIEILSNWFATINS